MLINKKIKKQFKAKFNAKIFIVMAGLLASIPICLLLSTPAQAQLQKQSLTAIPPRLGDGFDLRAAPGETIQATVRVRNSSNQALTIQSSFADFILSDDGKTPIPLDEDVSARWSMEKWVTISPQRQIVPAHQSAVVNVVINVPKDAVSGGHYGMVVHQPVNNINLPTSKSAINQQVGSLIYLMVEGPINEEAFIRELNFPQFTEYGPVEFSFLVENVSDIHIRPQIGVEIYNWLGQKVDTVSVEAQNVFPFTPRRFEGQWNRIWGIGRYRARVVMTYGLEKKVALAQTSFWLLPIKIIIAAILALMALIGILIAIRRYLIHRRDYNQQKIAILEKELQELKQQQNRNKT